MSELAFQYIGYGCVFLAALRVADVFIHVLLGIILRSFKLDGYYHFAVAVMSYERKYTDYTTVTGTRDDS
jgi:hypothetical protein